MVSRFDAVYEQIGLDAFSAEYVGENGDVNDDVMLASVAGLSEGDLAMSHPHYYGDAAELFGAIKYFDGTIARAVLYAAMENGAEQTPLYDFQNAVADYATNSDNQVPTGVIDKSISVKPSGLDIDGYFIRSARVPKFVMDLGACVSGRSFQDDQMAFPDKRLHPFTYIAIGRNHFINRFLVNSYDQIHGRGSASLMAGQGWYAGLEVGVAAATDHLIAAKLATDKAVDYVDIAVLRGLHHVDTAEAVTGIENSLRLLRDGGQLVLRSMAFPLPNEIGTDEMVEWAVAAGFQKKNMVAFDGNSRSIGSQILSRHYGERETRTVVLEKS
jgi:hypothetical protein